MIGIIILALNTGTLRISEILYQSTHNYEKLSTVAFVAANFIIYWCDGQECSISITCLVA